MRVLTYFHASTAKFGSFGLLFVLSELINFDYAMHFKISSLLVYSCVCVCLSFSLWLMVLKSNQQQTRARMFSMWKFRCIGTKLKSPN